MKYALEINETKYSRRWMLALFARYIQDMVRKKLPITRIHKPFVRKFDSNTPLWQIVDYFDDLWYGEDIIICDLCSNCRKREAFIAGSGLEHECGCGEYDSLNSRELWNCRTTNFEIDVENSELLKLYPEFIKTGFKLQMF